VIFVEGSSQSRPQLIFSVSVTKLGFPLPRMPTCSRFLACSISGLPLRPVRGPLAPCGPVERRVNVSPSKV